MKRLSRELNDFAWLHGHTAFTTVRTQFGEPLLWNDHLARLADTCRVLDLPDPTSEASKIEFAKHPEGRLRLTVTPGEFFWSDAVLAKLPSSVGSGVSLWIGDVRVHPQLAAHKTGNYLPYLLAARQAHAHGAFEGLLLGDEGVVDGSRTGFVLEIGGAFVVPRGGLPSVTRAALLRELGASFEVRPVTLSDFGAAQHVWIAGSGVGVLPVNRVAREGAEHVYRVRPLEVVHPALIPPLQRRRGPP